MSVGAVARRRTIPVIVGLLVGLVGCSWLSGLDPARPRRVRPSATVSASAPGAVPSNSTKSPVHLAVAASQASYRAGVPVSLRATVQNLSSTTCALEASADGALTVLTATRDGAAVSPSFTQADFINGAAELVTAQVQSAAPHGTVSFTMTTEPIQSGSALRLFTPQSDQSAVATSWSTAAKGHYVLNLTYQVPALAGANACAAQSNTVAVSFRVGSSSSGPNVLIYGVAAGGAGDPVGRIVVFGRSRRRRRGAQTTVAVGALLIGLLGSGIVTATPARADPRLRRRREQRRVYAYDACIAKINGFDPGFLGSFGSGVLVEPTSGPTQSTNQDSDGGIVHWNPSDKSHFNGDVDGADADPCASLFHELNHVKDASTARRTTTRAPATNEIPYKELMPSNAENDYRTAYGLQTREPPTAPKPLPTSAVHCGILTSLGGLLGKLTGDPHVTTLRRRALRLPGRRRVHRGDVGGGRPRKCRPGSRRSQGSTTVSVNSAIAIEVAGTRLGFYLEDGLIDVHRGGQSIQVRGRANRPRERRHSRPHDPIRILGDNYQVQWADGTVATRLARVRLGPGRYRRAGQGPGRNTVGPAGQLRRQPGQRRRPARRRADHPDLRHVVPRASPTAGGSRPRRRCSTTRRVRARRHSPIAASRRDRNRGRPLSRPAGAGPGRVPGDRTHRGD